MKCQARKTILIWRDHELRLLDLWKRWSVLSTAQGLNDVAGYLNNIWIRRVEREAGAFGIRVVVRKFLNGHLPSSDSSLTQATPHTGTHLMIRPV